MQYVIRPDNDVLKTVVSDLGNLNPEKEWSVEIKPYKKNLTREQRNYYHKLLEIISEYSGDTIDDLKTRMCYTLGYTKEVTVKEAPQDTVRAILHKAIELLEQVDGPIVSTVVKLLKKAVKTRVVTQRLSTEDLNREEYSKMIEAAQMACLHLDLQYPEPSHYGL